MNRCGVERNDCCRKSYISRLSDFINTHRTLRSIIDVIIVCAYIAFIMLFFGIWMEGNDDNTMAYISSGHITESPSPYLYFSNVILGSIISSCYKVSHGIPWYGIIQMIFIFALLFFSINSIEQRCESIISYCTVMLLSGVNLLTAMKMFAFVQFTTLSALMAIAGYVCLTMYKKKSHKIISFVLLELFAYLVRRASMLMIQPIGYTYFVVVTLWLIFKDVDKENVKKKIREFLLTVGTVFAAVLVIAGIPRAVDRYVYSDEKWINSRIIEDFRCQTSDFYYMPDYDEVADILEKYNVNKYEYEAMKSTRMIEIDKFVEPAKEISAYLKSSDNKEKNDISIMKMLLWVHGYSLAGHWNIALLIVLLLMALVLSDRPKTLITVATYFIGKTVTWGYIFFRQRIVERVMEPLYFSETVFLLCMIMMVGCLFYTKENMRTRIAQIASFVICLIYALLGILTGKEKYSECKIQSNICEVFYSLEREVTDYCNRQSDRTFLISGEMTIYWKYPLISTAYSAKDNYTFLGGWFCPAPMAQKYIEEFIDDDKVYLVLTSDIMYEEAECDILNYCEEYFGVTPEFEEMINTSIGEYAKVYRIK